MRLIALNLVAMALVTVKRAAKPVSSQFSPERAVLEGGEEGVYLSEGGSL